MAKPMFLDIHEIEHEVVSFDHPLQLSELGLRGGVPVGVLGGRMAGEARRGSRGVELRAELEARLGLECSRCLESFEFPVAARFFLVLVPSAVEFGTADSRLRDDDISLFYAEGGKADLDAIAAEQLYLNLPLKPVCATDCRGLCPTCGVNRNRLECACRQETADPRLAPLLEFKKRNRGP